MGEQNRQTITELSSSILATKHAQNLQITISVVEITYREQFTTRRENAWICRHANQGTNHRATSLNHSTNGTPIMLPIPRLRTLSAFHYVLCLRCQIYRSLTFETTRDNFSHLLVRQPQHIFLQAVDAPQLQISSN